MSEVLNWLEEESDRLTEECHSNADPHKTVNNSFLEGFNYALANVQGLEQPQLNDNQLKTIKSWGNLAAGEFGQEWTEDDESAYRELFGESLIVLPDEVEEEE